MHTYIYMLQASENRPRSRARSRSPPVASRGVVVAAAWGHSESDREDDKPAMDACSDRSSSDDDDGTSSSSSSHDVANAAAFFCLHFRKWRPLFRPKRMATRCSRVLVSSRCTVTPLASLSPARAAVRGAGLHHHHAAASVFLLRCILMMIVSAMLRCQPRAWRLPVTAMLGCILMMMMMIPPLQTLVPMPMPPLDR